MLDDVSCKDRDVACEHQVGDVATACDGGPNDRAPDRDSGGVLSRGETSLQSQRCEPIMILHDHNCGLVSDLTFRVSGRAPEVAAIPVELSQPPHIKRRTDPPHFFLTDDTMGLTVCRLKRKTPRLRVDN